MAKKEEKKSLDDIVKDLDKQYGKGSVMHGDEIEKYEDVVSTGSLGLDIATGIGGIPVGDSSGKIVELFGWESTGKSTIVQSVIGNYQKKFKRECLYVDGENSIDDKYSSRLGIDLKKLWTVQLDESAGEGAYNKAEKLVESGEFGLVVYDSYNSLQPKKIIDGEVGDNNLGLHARMLGQAVQKANNLCTKYGTTFLFVGQLREKIGVMYGDPSTTQGGNALKFYAHMRFKTGKSTTKDNSVMDGDSKIGNLFTVDVIKNKLAPPYKRAQFNILYGEGVDTIQEIIDIGHDLEILKVRGESLTYDETKYLISDFKQMLIDNPVFEEELRLKIITKCKS
jgi:recombination protein RecA